MWSYDHYFGTYTIKTNDFKVIESLIDEEGRFDFNVLISQPKQRQQCPDRYINDFSLRDDDWFDEYNWNKENWGSAENVSNRIASDYIREADGYYIVEMRTESYPFQISRKLCQMFSDREIYFTYFEYYNILYMLEEYNSNGICKIKSEKKHVEYGCYEGWIDSDETYYTYDELYEKWDSQIKRGEKLTDRQVALEIAAQNPDYIQFYSIIDKLKEKYPDDFVMTAKTKYEIVRYRQDIDRYALILIVDGIIETIYSHDISELIIPEGVKSISNNALRNAGNLHNSLRKIVFPSSFRYLESSSFANYPNLETVKLSSKVRYIEPYCFAKCSKLKDVKISKNTRIGAYAFSFTPWLDNKLNKDNMLICRNNLVKVNPKMEKVIVPENIKIIEQAAFSSMNDIKPEFRYVELADSVKEIRDYAFSGCSKLKSIRIPADLEFIGRNAFEGCSIDEIITDNTEIVSVIRRQMLGIDDFYGFDFYDDCLPF